MTASRQSKVVAGIRRGLLPETRQLQPLPDIAQRFFKSRHTHCRRFVFVTTIQNAADPEWSAGDPANAGMRDEFRLNSFPPSGVRLRPRRLRLPRLKNENTSAKNPLKLKHLTFDTASANGAMSSAN
jgi:hypothetical protein